MKFLMIILICFGSNCEAIWEMTPYSSEQECIKSSTAVADYMKDAFPMSNGKIFCVTEEEFDKMYKDFEKDGDINLPGIKPIEA